jgi:ribosomal-protein-serine acetyltransferase
MFAVALHDGYELRLLEEHHAERIFAAVDRNREHLAPWLPWVEATQSPEDTLAFIRKSLEQFARHEGFAAAIWRGEAVIGCIGLHPINWANANVELGYWIASEHQGRGVIRAACRTAMRYCFEDLGLERVAIHCAEENRRSCAVAERLGFQYEGTLRHHHKLPRGYVDIRVYSLLASEWESRRDAGAV